MEVIPAIDIKNGKCVRLEQGDFKKEKVYDNNPLKTALHWQDKGAKILHVVDLDGAKDGRPRNMALINDIIAKLKIPVQVGGGIRNTEIITEYLNNGVFRVIIGTMALKKPELINKLINEFGPERIIAGVDARNGFVAVKGWLETSEKKIQEVITALKRRGVKTFIYTDISRDGMLSGPDIEGLKELKNIPEVEIIASGGITTGKHLEQLEKIGINHAVVGKALYSGRLNYKNLWGGRSVD